MTISMLGIDIAKNTFQLHDADNSGKAVQKKRLARRELAAYVANLPTSTIVMEVCMANSKFMGIIGRLIDGAISGY